MPSLKPLLREFLPEHLDADMKAAGVVRTVLVQAASTEAETDFMLDLADQHEFIGAVVGWVDLSKWESAATLERWAAHPKFRGVRPMLQDLPQVDWIAHAPHPDVVRTLIRLGLSFDALVTPMHLPHLLKFLRAWPELKAVIDHAAKPCLARGWGAVWVSAGASTWLSWRSCRSCIASSPDC